MRSKRFQRGWWQYIIPAVASVASSLLSKSGQEDANETNLQLGREQMDFQERMSNSAYQRATADMQSAGLNPMLAFSQGGASTPQGSMPRMENTMSSVPSSAASGMALSQSMQMNSAQMDLVKAQADKIRSETMDQQVNTAQLMAQIQATRSQANKHNVEADKTWHENLGKDLYTDLAAAELQDRQGRAAMHSAQGAREQGSWEADVRRRKAEAKAAEFGLSEQESMSKFWEKTGDANPYLKQLLMLFRAFSSARSVLR